MGQYLDGTETIDDKVVDMSPSNNRYSHDVNVQNFAPQILSLQDDAKIAVLPLISQPERPITMTAQAFDVEGGLLTYIWTDSMGNDLGLRL